MSGIVFDSSTLISLGNSCLHGVLVRLKKYNPDIKLFITPKIRDEVIEIGHKTKRFAWNGIRINRLLKENIIEVIIPNKETVDDLDKKANNIFRTPYGRLEIMQTGELEALAAALDNNLILAVDEITTRLLIEKPKSMLELMKRRYKTKIFANDYVLKNFYNIVKNINIVRSVDIVAFAHKLNLFPQYPNLSDLEAMLFALKYSGCAVRFEEIETYLKEGL